MILQGKIRLSKLKPSGADIKSCSSVFAFGALGRSSSAPPVLLPVTGMALLGLPARSAPALLGGCPSLLASPVSGDLHHT